MGRLALPGFRVCEPCLREGMVGLDDIERIAHALWTDPESLLLKRGSDSGRSSSVPRSMSPADDAVLAVFDWRSIATRRGEPEDFEMVVNHWADRVCADLGQFYPVPPPGRWPSVMVLRRWWHWLCKQDFAGLAVWELTNVATVLRDVAHESRGKARLGRCPEYLDGMRCGYLLMVRPDADHLGCPRCGKGWPRENWRRLASQIEAADDWDRATGSTPTGPPA
ncbi:hypothetical protein SAMN04488074_105121 [Lentzea albidocapillata subsp. violacea]|uniref:Uncharacterized protein n=1 Tax=Lentzea albidocapillata subsp. violacea TaxID=128104 RepID=A0A1G9AUB7_9PSEU|nr:hypothetical protein [Lentzea albidocapillata]SDK30837.1 hypothetical protein SAMN04488074_105121 [Lentzea albidocapillata subsp. violacea]